MKRVLLVATVQSHIVQFHRPLVELLHDNGYEVHATARDNLSEKNGLKLNFVDKVINLPFTRSPKSVDNFRAYRQLKHIVDNSHYDIIHCNTPMGGIIARLSAIKTRKNGTRVIYMAHGFHFYKGASLKNWLLYYPIEKIFSKLTDTLITITKEDYKLALEKFHCKVEYVHGVGVNNERYYSINDNQKELLKTQAGYKACQKLILCIGELNDNKNQAMAIRMMHFIVAKYPDALLLLAGNGPNQTLLEDLIVKEGIVNNVRMLGYITNLQDYQHIVDLQVSCSNREGLPLNIVESMLSGNAVVATSNRGHCELIEDSINGYIVPKNDFKEMANKVLMLFENNNLKKQIEVAAAEKALHFTFVSVKKDLKKILSLK